MISFVASRHSNIVKLLLVCSQLDLGDGDSLTEFTTYLERIHSKLNDMGLGAYVGIWG